LRLFYGSAAANDTRPGADLFSRAAPTYNRVGPRPFTHFAQRIVELADVRSGSRVLDVATGTGEILFGAAERVGEEGSLLGIDLSEPMLARAADHVRRTGLPNVELQLMDACRLDLPSESFDRVFCGFALGSFDDQPRALTEQRRVIRPGGRLGMVEAGTWFFQHDPRWSWQADLFERFGVAVGDYEPDSERTRLVRALSDAGFADVVAREEACPLDFSGEEEWWAWMWSHGSRRLLEAVGEDRRPALKRALMAGLAARQGTDGGLHGQLRAHLVVAA
jgi:ubiquinone/menaquinone biosynthesis C-methylase UbiE